MMKCGEEARNSLLLFLPVTDIWLTLPRTDIAIIIDVSQEKKEKLKARKKRLCREREMLLRPFPSTQTI